MFDVLKTLSTLVKTKQPQAGKTPKHHANGEVRKTASEPEVKVTAHPPVQQPLQKQQAAPAPQPAPAPKRDEKTEAAYKAEMDAQLKIAEARAKELVIEAKDDAYRIRREAEDEIRRKTDIIERREGAIEEREKRLRDAETDTAKRLSDADNTRREWASKLEKVANLTEDEAREFILSETREKMKGVVAKEIKEATIRAEEEADVKSREILVDAMRHGVNDYIAEYTVSAIKIPDEDMKGRIIGKEGRNIRAFETATGVDVDLDEEGVIRLSCFDPVRREIARVALERLMKDGRVQPGRIEEVVDQVRKEIERIMFEEGQKLCHAVGVYNLPSPIVAMLGRFKYRFSYGQNMIAHTLEETKIGIAIAKEIGADANVVRLGCLLHDIGKVINDKEGTHVELGVELLKKYGLPKKVIDCVAQHHEDTPFSSPESVITYIADAISGGRPGARYEDYEEYIKRLKSLEEIAKSNHGVREAFAFQAGRELRVMVDPGLVDDASATLIAQKIKEEIEDKVTFPGQIKVTVVRELRATEIAK